MERILAFVLWIAIGNMIFAQEKDVEIHFKKLVDSYFAESLNFNPTKATELGLHEYDAKMEDFSEETKQSQIHFLQKNLREFQKMNGTQLSLDTSMDLELVEADIQAKLLSLTQIKFWENNPDLYSSIVSKSAFLIVNRAYATSTERLKYLILREKQMPKIFTQAKENLHNPPRIYTEIALEQIPGIVLFFRMDIPKVFENVKDKALLQEFAVTNKGVIDSLEDYQRWLKKILLTKSTGDFRLGTENFKKKLLYEEMVDEPLEHLLEMGFSDIRKNQAAFQEIAKKLDPTRTPQQILGSLVKNHSTRDTLLDSVRQVLNGSKQFLLEKHIVTLSSQVLPIVQETPPFARALSLASMDAAGPFETNSNEAFCNVTLPEKNWTPQHTEEHLQSLYHEALVSTTIHEAFPGHYVQALAIQGLQSKVRKMLLDCGTNSEGWAHYTEQMMLDEGFGDGDLKLRLGQLQDALLRNARYIVAIKMHTGEMSFDKGVEFFEKEGYQTRANAVTETKRGTMDPTYLVYTLGKLQILQLREDYKKQQGDKYSLKDFHDRFLKQGAPPLRIVRRALINSSNKS